MTSHIAVLAELLEIIDDDSYYDREEITDLLIERLEIINNGRGHTPHDVVGKAYRSFSKGGFFYRNDHLVRIKDRAGAVESLRKRRLTVVLGMLGMR